MKCPNCSSSMFISEQNATSKSLVKFFRCTNCIGEHVMSEPLSGSQTEDDETAIFASDSATKPRHIQMV